MRQDFIRLKVMEAMKDKGVRTGDIAKVLGTSSGSAGNVLLGKASASEERWRIICTVVGVNLDEIIQAEMAGRLPGICEVEEAWAALRSGEPYTRLEILAEELPQSADKRLTAPPEEEPFGGIPCCGTEQPTQEKSNCGTRPNASLSEKGGSHLQVTVGDSPDGDVCELTFGAASPSFTPDELSLLLQGLTLVLQNAIRMSPVCPDMNGIGRFHQLTGLMLRLNAALEGDEEHAG